MCQNLALRRWARRTTSRQSCCWARAMGQRWTGGAWAPLCSSSSLACRPSTPTCPRRDCRLPGWKQGSADHEYSRGTSKTVHTSFTSWVEVAVSKVPRYCEGCRTCLKPLHDVEYCKGCVGQQPGPIHCGRKCHAGVCGPDSSHGMRRRYSTTSWTDSSCGRRARTRCRRTAATWLTACCSPTRSSAWARGAPARRGARIVWRRCFLSAVTSSQAGRSSA